MPFKIFFSWQAKTDTKYNRNFIENCLKKALKSLKKEFLQNAPDLYIDRDTKDVPGSPNIPSSIEGKIAECDIFLADLTYASINKKAGKRTDRSGWDKFWGLNKWKTEGNPSINVAQEIGMAMGGFRGSERIIVMMNIAYGTPEQIYFDRQQNKYPITYEYSRRTTQEKKEEVAKNLVKDLKEAIENILTSQHERQKEYFRPFMTWKHWQKTYDTTLPFERTDYINSILEDFVKNVVNMKVVYRLCGLAGIGKTRLLFECFSGHEQQELVNNKILYVDINEAGEQAVLKAIRELIDRQENKILFIDNCPREWHTRYAELITHGNSRLSAVTVSSDPDEKANQLDINGETRLILINNEDCKIVVRQILTKNFPELQPDEMELLVEFSSGIPLIATLMSKNTDRPRYQPGTLNRDEIVRRLLGALYENEYSRAVIKACSLFAKFGYFEDREVQVKAIAVDDDFVDVKPQGANEADLTERKLSDFKQVCEQLRERQLLEKKGRTYAFRPSPLAVRMAEEWWRSCNPQKFQRIIKVLNDASLVEDFCQQFRYLSHIDRAKEIVGQLCGDFFRKAEVLNTEVGSRLFRTFVYVNRTACANALAFAFNELPVKDLKEIIIGRRNLIWALEKLVFWKESFEPSVKTMAAFAAGENENIGNNATNQFLQLFHIHLPGTQVDLEKRWEVIKYCLSKEAEYRQLGLRALASALNVGHFSRMTDAEERESSDYQPIGKEIYAYWQKCVDQLQQLIYSNQPEKDKAVGILFDKFYGLCSWGAGKIIIPVILKLMDDGYLNKMEVRRQIQFMTSSGRVVGTAFEELKNILNELQPTDIFERFEILVKKPTTDEYITEGGSGKYGERLYAKIEQFVDDFINIDGNWDRLSDAFFDKHLAEGFNFGKIVSAKASAHTVEILIATITAKLKIVATENRNLSVLLGLLSNYKNKEFVTAYFNDIQADKELSHVAFLIARSVELPMDEINKLLDKTENGSIPIHFFNEFIYGWGIRHLPQKDITNILQRLRAVSDVGKGIAFGILTTMVGTDKETFSQYKTLIKIMVLEDTDIIFDQLQNSMDFFHYFYVLEQLLTEDTDEQLAQFSIALIIRRANQMEFYYHMQNGFQKILNILQNKYFPVLWKHLTAMYKDIQHFGMAAFHLRDLLGSRHDYNHVSEGLLFSGNPEKFQIIIQWCREQEGNEIIWIAEMLPIYDMNNKKENWHPYTLQFINEFGREGKVLSGISAKLGTYSWVGSITDKLHSELNLFGQLLEHPIEEVQKWAELNTEYLKQRIKIEKNTEEEGF